MPTREEILARRARLSATQQQQLDRRLRGEISAQQRPVHIPRRSVQGPAVLSFAQQRLWFLDQLEPGSPFYNIPEAVRLQGILDTSALQQSLMEVVQRHDILRTTFDVVDEQAVQIVTSADHFQLSLIELQDIPLSEREAELHQRMKEEAQRPFDLTRGPLLRATLLRLNPTDHVLLLVVHHIIADGWSMGIFVHEVATCYSSIGNTQPISLPDLPVQYADFSHWQREWLQSGVLDRQMNYWKQQLSGELPVLDVPTDRPRPAVLTAWGARHPLSLPNALTEQLKTFSQQEGVTLFMTLLTAFQILLARYTRQEDILIGSPIANRNRGELEPLIGCFVNTLVLRADLSGNPTVRNLLQHVRKMTQDAYAHQDVPFEKLVEELHPERDMSRTPLFQVLFVLQNMPQPVIDHSDVTMQRLMVDSGTAKFDITLELFDDSTGLNGSFEYNTMLFNAGTITRMAEHFETLLKGMVEHPDQRIGALPLLSQREQQQLLHRSQTNTPTFSRNMCLHTLFERQAAQTPDTTAVVYEGTYLSYNTLNQRANQVAHHLQHLGVGPNVLVGLSVERSLDLVIGLLAILKAGGAYVPLDPTYPPERLGFMIADAQMPVILTQKHIADQLPDHQATLVCIDDATLLATTAVENPDSQVTTHDLAYIIYTSGSTGQPKGTLVTHAHVDRLFTATQDWYHFDTRDVWTLFHSFAFDFSVWELWGALLYGGRLVIVPYMTSRSPEAFYQLLMDEQVTVLNQTPSAFEQLIHIDNEALQNIPQTLRLVIFGGEALDLQTLQPWFARHGDTHPQLVNMYGITETTVHVTYRPIKASDLTTGLGSVIGVPIPDLQLYVLDQYQKLLPTGIPGELYVGGAGVAEGYLNRPELTKERFIVNPCVDHQPSVTNGASSAARLYKTGDLVRYRANGELEYLGRIDQQVKIRGFRIELGDIEAALTQYAGIRTAVVLAREDTPGEKRLVGYIVPHTDQEIMVSDVRAFLQTRVPEYMVPSAFVVITELPLTSNGKLDRRALPLPDTARPTLEQAYVAPRNATEEHIGAIWREVLNIERVGIHDNFFELGGHSLMATQFMSRLRNDLQVVLPLRVLFESPTIAALGQKVDQNRQPAALNQTKSIARVSRKTRMVGASDLKKR